jgi:predicted DNA-binding protein (MmcQ/YjbR family)
MSSPTNFSTLIQDRSPEVQNLAQEARSLIADLIPTARQQVSAGWGGYLLFKPDFEGSNAVCWLTVHNNHISIGFSEGVSLDDPAGLLVGKGKHSRLVKVKSLETLRSAALRELIAAAWARLPDPEALRETLERTRALCLSWPGTSETLSHGHPTFWAGKKTFAVYGLHSPSIAFKAASSMHLELEGDPLIFPTPYLAHNGWLSLRLDGQTDWAQARRLLEHSYRQVATRKLQAALHSGSDT